MVVIGLWGRNGMVVVSNILNQMVLYRLYFQSFTEKHRDKTDVSALQAIKCRCPFTEMALDRVAAVMLPAKAGCQKNAVN